MSQKGDSVIKDYGQNSIISRLYGRICIRWEEAALKKLKGLEGIPLFQGRPTPYSLKMENVPGQQLVKFKPGELSVAFFEKLVSLFGQMHQRGVAHGDAHYRNILRDKDRPYLLDFSTSYIKGRLPLLDEYIFRCFTLLDLERLYDVEKTFFGRGKPPKMFFLYRIVKRKK